MKAETCFAIALALAMQVATLTAHETEEKTPDPGFRPECERSAAFVAEVNAATIRVYPTIIRSPTNTTFSVDSQQQVISFLNGEDIAKAVPDTGTVDPGELKGRGQFEWFNNDLSVIGQELQKQKIEEEYILVMEILFPPQRGNRQMVFGIHCLLLDAAGENVFSFLLNSHHRMFVDADMVADDSSEQSRAELIRKATAVGMQALALQMHNEKMHSEKMPTE